MSLRQREYVLEALEQRLLLSADGLAPTAPTPASVSHAPVEIVVIDETAGISPVTAADPAVDTLVDTTAPVANVTETKTEATDAAPVTTATSETPSPTNEAAPVNPEVQSAADLLVATLTAGNGPPAEGTNYSVGDSGTALDFDPPIGGFNFTPDGSGGSNPATEKAALLSLFRTGAGSTVVMHGTMVKRDDAGSSTDYSVGQLAITGTFNIARHLDGGTPAVDSAGRYVFEVWFTTSSTVAFSSGGVTLNMVASKGAFLVSGLVASGDDVGDAYPNADLGGGAGTLVIENIAGLAGTDETFAFGTLTAAGGVAGTKASLNVKTAAGLANGTQTTSLDIAGTGLGASFAGATNSIKLSGHVSITFGATVGLTFNGDVSFQVADTNGGTAGGQVLTISLTNATAALSVAGVTVTASGINATFQFSTAGVVGNTTIAGLNVVGGGVTVNAFTNGTFNIDTTGPTTALTIGATVKLAISQGGVSASLGGSFTFDRGMLGTEEVIRLSATSAYSNFTAGTTSLDITDINGAFVIKSNGFAGKASVGALSLTVPIPGFVFGIIPPGLFFEINTTDALIENLVIPGSSTTLNFATSDRKKFFRLQGSVTLDLKVGGASGIGAHLDGTFYFEQYTLPDSSKVVKFAAIGANASFSAGSVKLAVSGVDGGFLITNAGLAGLVTADAITPTGLPAGVTLGGSSLSFAINNTGLATGPVSFGIEGGSPVDFDYSDADELNFVSVGGTLTLGLSAGGADVSVTGSLAFYGGKVDGVEVVKVGLDGLSASIGVGGITATITDIEGIVVIMDAGVAGRIQFDKLTLTGAGPFTFEANDFAFEFNTTTHAIDEALTIGAVSQTLSYTTPETANFFRGSGHMLLAFDGGGFALSLDGTYAFEVYTMVDSGEEVVKFAFEDVSFEVGVGGGGVKLVINDADGFFIFGNNSEGDASYAGRLSITSAELQGVTGLTFTITSFDFETNTFGESVEAEITRPSLDPFVLDFTAENRWNFLSLGGRLNFRVQLGGLDFYLGGGFYFEQSTVTLNAGTVDERSETTILVSVADAGFNLGVGEVVLEASKITGAFIIQGDGKSAGRLTIGKVELTGITGLTFKVTNFALEFNNTGGKVKVSIPLVDDPDDPDDPTSAELDYTTPEFYSFLRVGGTLNLKLEVGSFVADIHGTFVFEQTPGKMKIGIRDAGVTVAVGTIALEISEVNGLFVVFEGKDGDNATDDGTLALNLSVGEVKLTGISGLKFEVSDFFLQINNTEEPVHETFTFPDDGDPDTDDSPSIDFEEDILALGGTVVLELEVGAFKATVEGTFLFEQTSDKLKVGIRSAGITVVAGSVQMAITDVNGLFVVYEGTDDHDPDTDDGTLAMTLSIGHVDLPTLPGLTFEVSDFFLKINNTDGPVHETFNFADDGDPDTDDSPSIDFDGDILSLGGHVLLGIEVGSFVTQLEGSFSFEQSTVTDPDTNLETEVIKVSVTHASLLLSVGASLSITEVNGAFVILPTGSAGKLSVGSVTLAGIPQFSLVVQDFYLEFNNTGHDVEVDVPTGVDPDDVIELRFTGANRHDFILVSGTVIIGIGGADPANAPMLQLKAVGVTVDTGATGSDPVFSAVELSGKLTLAALGGSIKVSAHNLAITADGDLTNLDDPLTAEVEKFGVEVFFGGTYKETIKTAGADGIAGNADDVVTGTEDVEYDDPNLESAPDSADLDFKWPSWMPLKLRYIGLEWDDVTAHPEDFDLTISAAVSIAVPGIVIAGYVENMVIDVGDLLDGKFPIKSFDAAALYVEGHLFGMTVGGGFVMGMIEVDAANHEVDGQAHPELVDHTLFYAGLYLKVEMLGSGGVQFAVGLAKIGDDIVPLEVMVGVKAPILIEPISGLTLGEFAGRVQFGMTLNTVKDYTVMANLRAAANNPGGLVAPENLDDWVDGLKSATLELADTGTGGGPVDVWSSPMTITVLARFYSSYVSEQALNGLMVVSFDTEGRILIAGALTFGGGAMKLNAALYADLTQVNSANFSFSFFASYGAAVGPKIFEIEASLKVKILKSTIDPGSGEYEVWSAGDDVADQATLSLEFDGKVRFLAGGAMLVEVEGTVDLQVDLGPTLGVRLRFNAQISIVDPTPNPLGEKFGELAGFVSIFEDADGFQMFGAVMLLFKPDTLKDYGIDVDATVFLQINTTAIDQPVTLEYFDGDIEPVVIRAESFSLYLKGELTVGPPGSDPADAFIKMNGFVIIEIDENGLTLVFSVDVELAPGGTRLLTLDATGFMRINGDGIAARLDMTLAADFPPSTGLDIDAQFLLLINTTGEIVHYDIPEFVLTGAPGEVTEITIAQAAPELAPLDTGDFTVAANGPSAPGEDYYIIAASGDLTALSFTLTGDFFFIITPARVQIQVNAAIVIDPLGSLEVHGFLEFSSGGAAGLLEVELDLDMLEDYGIDISGEFALGFNTYNTDYTLPDAVADQFNLPHGSKLKAGLIRVEIRGDLTIGDVLELHGRFFFEKTPQQTTLEVDATMSMPILGTLNVDGDFVLLADQGVVGSLVVTLQSAQGLQDIGITFTATILLKVNTTGDPFNDPGVTDDPAIDPEDQVMIAADTLILDMSGAVTLLGEFTFNGHFYFKKVGSDLAIRFDATLDIVVGVFKVWGDFNSTAAGFTAELSMSLQSSASLASLGFELTGDFLFAINSSNTEMTVQTGIFAGTTVAVDSIKIIAQGSLKILDGFLKLEGRFEVTQGPGYLDISINASINLAGLVRLNVIGFAGIYTDNPATTGVNEGGLVLSFDINANFSLSGVFTAKGDFAFRLNTTDIARTVPGVGSIAANYFRIAVTNLELSFLGVITVTGGLDISYTNGTGVLRIAFHASADFFGIGSVSLSGSADSSGKYDVNFDGRILIGIEDFFGVGGTIHFHIKGEGEGILELSGSIGGTAWLIGIGFGVNVGIEWDAQSGRLRASVSLRLNFFLFSITIRGNFDLGYIKSTITWQAGTANDTKVDNGEDFPGGELWVNVGDRAITDLLNPTTTGRNYSELEVDEQVFISQLAPGVIQVELFGKKKQYSGVTSVHVNTGSGNDYVFVESSVTLPVFIDLGTGDDMVDIGRGGANNNINIWGGSGNDTINGGGGIEHIYGGDGDDYLTGGGGADIIYGGEGADVIEGGPGADTLYGENGDDSFVWASGDGTDAVISGAAGANSLSVIGDNNANSVTVTANGTNFTAVIDGATLNPTNVGAFYANLNGGADSVTIGLLDSTILDTVSLSLGYGDNAADQVTIAGSALADYYHFKSESTTGNRPVSTSYADPLNPVTTYATVTTVQVRIAKTDTADSNSPSRVNYYIEEGGYANDRVIVNAGDGADVMDASDVVHAGVKLSLNGGNGNDSIVGSSYNDAIDSGSGDDTVTGGPGVDTFADADGDDTLIEQMDRNFTLNGWLLISGSESETLAVFETIRLTGGASANTFTISNLLAATLWLDGGEHNDIYNITIRGSGTGVIHVFDGGVGVPNTDSLLINGTAGDDVFLIRDGIVSAGATGTSHYEVIDFGGINSFTMHGGNGRDSFTLDEIRSTGAIYGDDGDDTFYVGRILADEGQPAPTGINTIDTTRGWLSYGNFAVFEIYGGNGDDTFEVNHNQAELRLFGENGDDLFWVRTFLEEGSALSTVTGGDGLNTIRYVKNGPLKIDGGAGFDRLVLEGTEADDVFIITDTQIFGGGRQIDFVNIEGIVLLGVGGNDTFYVLGNGLPLDIQGGTGNDTVYIGGQAPDYLYDAPAYIVDPPAYIDHYDPVYTTPPPIVLNIPAHWEPVRWAGITWWWNWVNAYQIVIPRAPYISSWTPVWVDPPEYTVDPTPVTYKFKEVTQFNGVVSGVEVYNWATATSGAGSTPTSTINLGRINSPVKYIGGNDPGIATENDRLIVNLGTATTDLQATMQTVDEIITDFDLETRTEIFTNKGPIGQLLGLGLPNAVTRDGRTFMGGLTFLGVETSQFTFGTGNDTFTLNGTFNAIDVTVNGNGGNDTFNVQANSGDLVINGGAGDDTFNLDSTAPNASNGTLNGITGPVALDGGAGTDTLYLDDRADTDDNLLTVTTSMITGLGTGGISYLFFEGITAELGSGADTVNVRTLSIPLTLNTGAGNDTVYVSSSAGLGNTNGTLATIVGALTINGGTGGATAIFDDTGDGTANSGTLTSTTLTGLGLGAGLTYASLSDLIINLGGGGNTFTIASTHTTATHLSTGGGNDAIAIQTVAGATFVNAGAGSDIVRIGTLAPTMGGGNLNGISGLLTLEGGADFNQLLLDDTGDTSANNGSMTAATIRGLGMALGVDYTNFASVQISLGAGGDAFAVAGTIAGATTVNLGAGNDALTLTASAGTLTISGGVGADTFNIQGSGGTVTLNGDDDSDAFNFDSNAPNAANGTLNAIAGVMIINGGNGLDAIYLDDRLDSIDNILTLTSTAIAGLGLSGGITYENFESLSIFLGSGNDTANIRNIAIPTFLNTGGGNDQVFVGSNAGLGNTNGNLSGIGATLTVDGGGAGTAVLTLDDTGDATANTGNLTATTITGLGLATSVTYTGITILNVNLGDGGNTFTIASTHTAATNLSTGAGADSVAVRTVSGATNIDAGGGDDTVRVGSVAPAATGGILNGISGLLTLTGGTGANQLFLDDSGDATANTGTLTATTLRGLGMALGVNYTNFAGISLGLGSGSDVFTITSTHAGTTDLDLGPGDDALAVVSIAGVTTVDGGNGDDTMTANSTHLVGTNPIGAVLNLDGNEGGDRYFVWFSGAGTSVIKVHDTGVAGTNYLDLYDTPANDTVLFRREYVALLQYDSAGVQLPAHEQVNYDTHINGTLTLTSRGGANYFAFDDNSAHTVINGANEGDSYQIGQIFGPTFVDTGIPQAELIEVTRGWLSHGISYSLTLNGGSGDDLFSVYHNRALLDLNGADGDDTFVIRAFALAGSVNGEEVFDALRGSTNVATGGGVNHISYALNAPVAIDGGSGFNSVVVVATEFSDSIVVTKNGVYGGGLYVEFINIQELVINLAEGNDRIWILGTPAGTAVRIVAGLGSDTVYLGGTPDPIEVPVLDANGDPVHDANGDVVATTQVFPSSWNLSNIQGPLFIEGGLGNGVPNLEPGVGLPGEPTGPLPDLGNVNLFVNENLQVDRIVVNDTGNTTGASGTLTSDRLTGFGLTGETVIDVVAFPAGMGYLEFEEIVLLLGSGSDTLTIESTHEGRTIVEGNDGSDTVNVRSISGHTTLLGGNGNDTINVGSLAPLTGGNLDGIDALLAIDGGAGADTVNVDQRGNTAGSTGWLTQTSLTGLEMTSALATVNDTISFRVNATSGTYTLSHGSATPEVLAWNATADDLTAALWRLLGNRNAFAQKMGDDFVINFQGGVRSAPVDLDVTGDVTVTHRVAGVNYYGIDTLNLDLGSGADVVNVQGTSASVATNLNTHAGEDRIYVSSAANLTTTTFTDRLPGHLDNVVGTLNIDAGTERNLLMVSDEASAVANGIAGTPAQVTNSYLRGLAPAQINYTASAGNFAQGITIWTGAGADVISVTSTDERAGVRTATTLNTGAGDDRVTVALNAASDGFFVLNTENGDDLADASASTLPIIIFGGAGNDILFGGTSGDILFGDNGRIQYLDGSTVVAVVGGAGPGDFTDGIVRDTYTLFTVDSAIGGNDTLHGLTGQDLLLGGAANDVINGGEGDNFVLGDHGSVTVVGGIVTSVATSTAASGGTDTITTLSGRDFILGGEAGDVIDAGAGHDEIAGDHGSFTIVSPTAFVFVAADFTIGGNDSIIAGAGDDTVFGGAADDTILGNDGFNLVLGDHGNVTRNTATGNFTVTSTAESTGGADTITTGMDVDLIFGGAGADVIDAGTGNDLILGDAGTATVVANLLVTLATTAPDSGTGDTIQGNAGDDVILAGDGDDKVDAGNGRNLVFGDHGIVTWAGTLVDEAITISQGNGGNDTITTGIDDDIILGGNGGDIVHSGAGADVIVGDQGVVTFVSGLATKIVNHPAAGDGNDQLFGEAGDDVILGGGGADAIDAAGDNNTVVGDHATILRVLNGVVLATATVTSGDVSSGGNDTIAVGAGRNLIIGGSGADTITVAGGTSVILGDQGQIDVAGAALVSATTLNPGNGADDRITVGDGSHWIFGGDAADIITAGNGFLAIFGDHGRIDLSASGVLTLKSIDFASGGADTITTASGADLIIGGFGADRIDAGEGNNVVVGDHAVLILNGGVLTSVESTGFADGGADVIFTASGNDLVIGGTAGDTIHSGAGNDLVFGDHAVVTGAIDLALLPLAMAVKPFTFASLSTQNLGADGRSVAGDDVVFAGAGDDIVFGQQGDDILFGEAGNDDLIGGHNVTLGQDGADVIDGGAGYDVIAGDNASVLRTGNSLSDRLHVLAGDAMFDDRGHLLDLDDPQAWPDGRPERAITILDHAFGTNASLFGNDQLVGGAGDDVLFGELGNDRIHGDAAVAVVIAADGTVDRGAVRATASALFTTAFWAGADSDGDDYLEGNGGDDLVFGGLGQDDIVGGSSSLFGLASYELRPDGSDTLFGGNGTAAADETASDGSANGRARDSDVIMGDNANIIRLVGINGVNSGAYLTFSYAPGASQILVRGFDFLDYTVPAAATDIGAKDTIYGEAGDDTLHGQVGNDVVYGNGNDDNVYGGQGDDKLFGGAGDDAISGSDELKPATAGGKAGAAEGNGAEGTAAGTFVLVLPSSIQTALTVNTITGAARYVLPRAIYTSFSTGGPVTINSRQGVSTTTSGWRIFASDILPEQELGNFSSNANEPVTFEALDESANPPAEGEQSQPPAPEPAEQSAVPPVAGEAQENPPSEGEQSSSEGHVPPTP